MLNLCKQIMTGTKINDDVPTVMSNLCSTQTKDKQLCLIMDELHTFYGIHISSTVGTALIQEDTSSGYLTVMYTKKVFLLKYRETALMKYWPQIMWLTAQRLISHFLR